MREARVLVVDDSAAMRALFCDVLDQAKDVRVVGTAASAAEARDQIATCKPNVITLDVEMPGMSGIDFLAEIMEQAPIPVVMLSSLTQSGTEFSLKAYDLGAVECFPKPLRATPEQFAKTVNKLGKVVLAAANSNVQSNRHRRAGRRAEATFVWNGQIVAMSAAMGGIDALGTMLAEYPAKCPPTVITLHAEPALVATFVERLDRQLKCSVRLAQDGAAMTQGHVYIASDPNLHVTLEPGTPPKLRLVARDPVDGARPSATLLFGTIARAGVPAVGAVLTGMGVDGARGLKLMREAGCTTLVQERASATINEAPAAAIAMDAAMRELPLDELAAATLASCNMASDECIR